MIKILLLVTLFFGMVSQAYAGKWVEGVGKTPEEALKNIVNKKVKLKLPFSNKEVLVSPGACYSGKTRYKGRRGDLYVFEGLWHNHKGTCD
jgi:hypothetical protein